MREQSILNPTFWSEVINFIGFSADHAENLRPMVMETVKVAENNIVLVFSTSVQESADLAKISGPLNKLIGKDQWTVDLDDEDKVLRVVCVPGKQPEIVRLFNKYGFACDLMPY